MKKELPKEWKDLQKKYSVLGKVKTDLEMRLSEADELLLIYNEFIKKEYSYASMLGTDIDKYLIKYNVKGSAL